MAPPFLQEPSFRYAYGRSIIISIHRFFLWISCQLSIGSGGQGVDKIPRQEVEPADFAARQPSKGFPGKFAMLQYCLYALGIIVLPLAVEAVLAPRPCLWLLRGLFPSPRPNHANPASVARHSPPPMPPGTSVRPSESLAGDNLAGSYLPNDMVLPEPRFRHALASVSPLTRMKTTKRFGAKD
jgi:hypothetical protein